MAAKARAKERTNWDRKMSDFGKLQRTLVSRYGRSTQYLGVYNRKLIIVCFSSGRVYCAALQVSGFESILTLTCFEDPPAEKRQEMKNRFIYLGGEIRLFLCGQ